MANPITPEERGAFWHAFGEIIPNTFTKKGDFLDWLDKNPTAKQA